MFAAVGNPLAATAGWALPSAPGPPTSAWWEAPPVFVVGMPKCGTTSLEHALESSPRYGSVHCYAPKPWGPNPPDRFVGHLMTEAAARGLPPLSLLPPWVNAVTQMDCWWLEDSEESAEGTARPAPKRRRAYGHFPQISLLEALDSAYPGAKFILNVRDSRRWLHSVKNYGPLHEILVSADLPGLPSGVGEDQQLIDWYEAHTSRVRSHFAGRGPDVFLEFRLEEDSATIQSRLEALLGEPVEWGHHNATTWA